MKARQIIDRISVQTGWNENSQIYLLCECLDSFKGGAVRLEQFLKEQADVEEQLSDEAEQDRRDEKHGLYGGEIDPAN